jgi:hypothetical protein
MMTSSKKPDKEISARVLIDPSGKMAGDSIPHLKNWLAAHANSYVDIVISELERTRNLSQNAYLHAIFAYFAEFIGDTPEHVKKRLKETWVPTGNIIVHAKGTPWEWKKNRNEVRAKLEEHYSFDTKHAMHLVRLMRMGVEILTTGEVLVKRPDAEELLAIRNGAWSYDQIIEYAEYMDNEVREVWYNKTSLPKKPNVKLATKVLIEVQDMCWNS